MHILFLIKSEWLTDTNTSKLAYMVPLSAKNVLWLYQSNVNNYTIVNYNIILPGIFVIAQFNMPH
jgi:hypothetical protein